MSIMDHFPGTPRPAQVEVLTFLEQNWAAHDAFAVCAPVASGKSRIARCLASWLESRGTQSAILTPNNVLVRQYAEEFPDLSLLSRRDSYSGASSFARAKGKAVRDPTLLANYHTYVSNRLFRDTIIVDEAHNVLPMLQERWSKKMWQRDWAFPDDMETVEDFVMWAETVAGSDDRQRKIKSIVREVVHDQNYTLEHTEDLWRGKASRVLVLKPLTVRDLKPWMWNRQVRKIVLMSATLSQWEIQELGLDRRRVAYIDVDSSIPAGNRPVELIPVANMAYENRDHSTPQIAAWLARVLKTRRDKGMIHVTYDVAARLRGLLSHERLIWHGRHDRQSQYEKFRASPHGVMVASGMSEGIDLAYDAARWQVICQMPFPNLGDTAIVRKAELQPSWYEWEALKALIQTIGRVCRAPDDYGLTEIIDSQAVGFFQRAWPTLPQHLRNSVHITQRGNG